MQATVYGTTPEYSGESWNASAHRGMVPVIARLLLPLLVPPPSSTCMHRHAHRVISAPRAFAAPSRKIDRFQTVNVVCNKCGELLFRYKKKNGLKSSLVKCYVERIVEDPHAILDTDRTDGARCPNCHSKFARDSLIHGRPALKMAGGKVRMTK